MNKEELLKKIPGTHALTSDQIQSIKNVVMQFLADDMKSASATTLIDYLEFMKNRFDEGCQLALHAEKKISLIISQQGG